MVKECTCMLVSVRYLYGDGKHLQTQAQVATNDNSWDVDLKLFCSSLTHSVYY